MYFITILIGRFCYSFYFMSARIIITTTQNLSIIVHTRTQEGPIQLWLVELSLSTLEKRRTVTKDGSCGEEAMYLL